MVRVKAKKAKGDAAFTARKQKVGRRKLAPATATRAEVHAKSLRVVVPTHVAREQKRSHGGAAEATAVAAGAAGEGPAADVREALANAGHYRAASRRAAFVAARRWVRGGRGRGPVRTLQLTDAALRAMTDTDDDVRAAAAAVLAELHGRVLGPSPALLPPVAPALLRHINIALTHAERSARGEAAALLSTLLGVGDGTPREAGRGDGPYPAATFVAACAAVPGLRAELRALLDNALAVGVATRRLAPFAAVMAALLAAPEGDRRAVLAEADAHAVLLTVAGFAGPLVADGLGLRAALFRDHGRVADVAALCHAVAYLMAASGSPRRLSRPQLARLRRSFVDAVPFSPAELCRPPAAASAASVARTTLACALAHVALGFDHRATRGAAAIAAACAAALLAAPGGPRFAFAAHLAATLAAAPLALAAPATPGGPLTVGAVVALVPPAMASLAAGGAGGGAASAEAARRSCLCVAVLDAAYEAGAAAAAGGAAAAAVAGLPRLLFALRRAAWADADVDRLAARALALLGKALCDRRPLLAAAERQVLRFTMASLFALPPTAAAAAAAPLPSPEGGGEGDVDAAVGHDGRDGEPAAAAAAVPTAGGSSCCGVVGRCAPDTAVAAAHAAFYASPAVRLPDAAEVEAGPAAGAAAAAEVARYSGLIEAAAAGRQLPRDVADGVIECLDVVPAMIREAAAVA